MTLFTCVSVGTRRCLSMHVLLCPSDGSFRVTLIAAAM